MAYRGVVLGLKRSCGFWQRNANQPDGSAGRKPGRQIGRTIEVQQGFRQCPQLLQRKGLDLGGGIRAERAAAADEEAKGHSRLAFLNAFLPALLPAFETPGQRSPGRPRSA